MKHWFSKFSFFRKKNPEFDAENAELVNSEQFSQM